MWWEQIQEYLHLTYQVNVETFPIHQTTENDETTTLREQIKGDITWALGPKAKYELMRGQWGREFQRYTPTRINRAIQKDIYTDQKCISQPSPIFQYLTTRNRNVG